MYISNIKCISLKPNYKWCTFSQSVIIDLAVKKVSSSPWVIWPCCKKSATSLSSFSFRGFRLKQLQYTSARIKNNSNIRAPITATTTCHQMKACLNWNMKRNSSKPYKHTLISNGHKLKYINTFSISVLIPEQELIWYCNELDPALYLEKEI